MDNPGYYSLGDVAVTTPMGGTAVGPGVTGLDGVRAALFEFKLNVTGTTGTTVDAYGQSRLSPDTDWHDVCHASFGGTSETHIFSVGGTLGTGIVPTDGALAANATQPLLGTEYRMKLSSTGTFAAGSILSGRVVLS